MDDDWGCVDECGCVDDECSLALLIGVLVVDCSGDGASRFFGGTNDLFTNDSLEHSEFTKSSSAISSLKSITIGNVAVLVAQDAASSSSSLIRIDAVVVAREDADDGNGVVADAVVVVVDGDAAVAEEETVVVVVDGDAAAAEEETVVVVDGDAAAAEEETVVVVDGDAAAAEEETVDVLAMTGIGIAVRRWSKDGGGGGGAICCSGVTFPAIYAKKPSVGKNDWK